MFRCSISLVRLNVTGQGSKDLDRLEDLKAYFNSGSLLESMENLVDFATFHIDWSDEQDRRIPSECAKNCDILTTRYKEISYFQSSEQFFGHKCFVILGFKLFLGGCDNYFMSNWRELCGLGNMLLFLSNKFQVGKVMLLQKVDNLESSGDMFDFMVMVEVFYRMDILVYLLDYVQRTKHSRNTGHVSVYREVQVSKVSNC